MVQQLFQQQFLGCFNELRVDQWDRHELSEMAFQAERLYLGVKGVGKINMLPFSEVLISWNLKWMKYSSST